jgi:hypothetical protein
VPDERAAGQPFSRLDELGDSLWRASDALLGLTCRVAGWRGLLPRARAARQALVIDTRIDLDGLDLLREGIATESPRSAAAAVSRRPARACAVQPTDA